MTSAILQMMRNLLRFIASLLATVPLCDSVFVSCFQLLILHSFSNAKFTLGQQYFFKCFQMFIFTNVALFFKFLFIILLLCVRFCAVEYQIHSDTWHPDAKRNLLPPLCYA